MDLTYHSQLPYTALQRILCSGRVSVLFISRVSPLTFKHLQHDITKHSLIPFKHHYNIMTSPNSSSASLPKLLKCITPCCFQDSTLKYRSKQACLLGSILPISLISLSILSLSFSLSLTHSLSLSIYTTLHHPLSLSNTHTYTHIHTDNWRLLFH